MSNSQPFVMGRHLIQFGLSPGPHFGPILKEAFMAQINGAFSDAVEGLGWLRKNNLIGMEISKARSEPS